MLTAQRAICYHPSFRFGGKATTANRMKKDCQWQNCSALNDLYYSAMLQRVLPLGVSNKDGVGKCQYLENGRRYVQSYYQWLIGSCIIMRFRLTLRSISQKWGLGVNLSRYGSSCSSWCSVPRITYYSAPVELWWPGGLHDEDGWMKFQTALIQVRDLHTWQTSYLLNTHVCL